MQKKVHETAKAIEGGVTQYASVEKQQKQLENSIAITRGRLSVYQEMLKEATDKQEEAIREAKQAGEAE